jgi:hypothetical protein
MWKLLSPCNRLPLHHHHHLSPYSCAAIVMAAQRRALRPRCPWGNPWDRGRAVGLGTHLRKGEKCHFLLGKHCIQRAYILVRSEQPPRLHDMSCI